MLSKLISKNCLYHLAGLHVCLQQEDFIQHIYSIS